MTTINHAYVDTFYSLYKAVILYHDHIMHVHNHHCDFGPCTRFNDLDYHYNDHDGVNIIISNSWQVTDHDINSKYLYTVTVP